ncbi:MAG: efflux RND transporter permease subunit, partial [Alphaproteobacteria bacterium]|nr:efflux RND transporter permease subunit [Alphaproteobacteria bacterium]
MNPSEPFVRRPVATVLLTFGILLLGTLAFFMLPIAALPSVDRPTIGVEASLPGASPDTIASSLAQPLERQLGAIPGIVEIGSFSDTGYCEVTMQFDLATDIDAAAGAVQAAINAAGPNLPQDLPRPPTYYKANPSGFSIITLALTSDSVDPGDVYNYAYSVVAEKLSQIDGVAKVYISGAERSAVRVQVDPGLTANMHLSLERIRSAIRNSTENLPKGTIATG